jgi:hypothetical protein
MIVLEILTHEMGLRKLDIFMIHLTDSIQHSYKGGWSHFVSFFIEEDETFPNWKDEDECIIVFGDFITWATDNIKLSEINIACSAISKMFQGLSPILELTKINQIISLKKGVFMSNPKQVKYLTLWNPDLVITYYTTTFTPNSKIQFSTKENSNIFKLLLYAQTFRSLSGNY